MAITTYTLVSYDGIDIGKLYLEDAGKRSQLGGGIQHRIGQDIIIKSGETIALVNTGEVLTSSDGGVINRFSTDNEPQVLADAIERGILAAGTTGMDAPLSLIPSDTVTGVVRIFDVSKTDPANTQGDF